MDNLQSAVRTVEPSNAVVEARNLGTQLVCFVSPFRDTGMSQQKTFFNHPGSNKNGVEVLNDTLPVDRLYPRRK